MMPRQQPSADKLASRAERFKTSSGHTKKTDWRTCNREPTHTTCSDFEFEQQLVGTCQLLEKCYLRLTSAPKESDVRPKPVLVKSLARVKQIWAENHDYNRCSELLKSIRQDMTVQGIRDEFSIEVYETHARLALQAHDHSEFNICQSVLKNLYVEVSPVKSNEDEFTAYRLLYYLFTRDLADLSALVNVVLLRRKGEESDSIKHSLEVTLAWLLGSHRKMFRLYWTAPFLSSYAMDLFLSRERKAYFKVLMKAYRPSVPVTFITSELGYISEEQTAQFLKDLGFIVYTDSTKTKIDCKSTLEKFV